MSLTNVSDEDRWSFIFHIVDLNLPTKITMVEVHALEQGLLDELKDNNTKSKLDRDLEEFQRVINECIKGIN